MGKNVVDVDCTEKREACGVVGIYSKNGQPVAPLLYRAMVALQHRGQDAAGFAVYNKGKFSVKRGLGLVYEIFGEQDQQMAGNPGIGHTRYPTTGRCLIGDVQPSSSEKMVVSHNGHISNYWDLRGEMERAGTRITSQVDSEVILRLLESRIGDGLEAAVRHAMEKLDGAYSVAGVYGGKLFAFRDPHAIRPLIYGEDDEFVCICSESAALDVNAIPYLGEIGAGCFAIVDSSGIKRTELNKKRTHNCMCEYVYFARPDSIINEKWVFEARKRLGAQLAAEQPAKADVVIAVPDTSRTAAQAFAEVSKLPIEEGLIKNRYIGRTFIMPNQQARTEAVKLKLNPIRKIIEGRRVVLVDDSIVRGTTLKEIVSMVREVGAKEIHVRITSPPINAPCFYGVDMSTYAELVAPGRSVDEIAKIIGADSLGYLSIGGLKRALGENICTGCLDEGYPTEYAHKLADAQKEKTK